jgi:hypothetical protein
LSPTALALAKQIQDTVPNFLHFTGLNDTYPREGRSHAAGRGIDFVLSKAPTLAEANHLKKTLAGLPGAGYALNEYFSKARGGDESERATGPHMHVGASAAKGGILTGPTSGYAAELHGTEAVVPLPDGRSIPLQSNPESSAMMAAQLDRLDTLISIMRNQVSISSKMLSYSS